MGSKLYVGNLAFTVDSNQLSGLFADHGTVESANIITDRETGRSKGFAFVEMSNENEATTIIEKLNGTELGGRAMNISIAKPQENRSSNRRGSFSPRRSY